MLRDVPLDAVSIKKYAASLWSIYRNKDTSFYPVFLGIESTAKCNLKCNFCPRTDFMTRDVGNMDLKLYKEIIDTVKPVFITLSQFGEPLIHPQIEEFINYADSKGVVVRITTNATLLSEKNSKMLVNSGLSHAMVSFDSCHKETYEKLRVGATFENVVERIKIFVRQAREKGGRYPIISFNVTLSNDNIHEIREMIDFCWNNFGIYPTFTQMYTYGEKDYEQRRAGKSSLEFVKEGLDHAKTLGAAANTVVQNLGTLYNKIAKRDTSPKRPCFWPYYTSTISWDGKVYPCCVHFDVQEDLGDLSKQSFKEVWNGDKYRSFRNRLNQGRDKIKLCSTCSLSDEPIDNAMAGVIKFLPVIKPFAGRKFGSVPVQIAPSV